MKTFAYIIGALILAIGLALLVGWPFWIIVLVLIIGASLHLLKIGGNAWTAPIAVVVAIFIIATLTFQFLTGQLPLTASLKKLILLSRDIRLAGSLNEPATEARATTLLLQNAREKVSAEKVIQLYQEGKVPEAMDLLKDTIVEGTEVRDIVSLKNTSKPTANQSAQTPAPTSTAMPPAQVAAAAPVEPPPPINISGDWSFDWGNTPSDFRISQIGNSFSGKSNYDPGVMIVKGSVTGNRVDGIWELIGSPSGHFQGEFHIASLNGTAGEGSWITYENGPPSSRLIISKI